MPPLLGTIQYALGHTALQAESGVRRTEKKKVEANIQKNNKGGGAERHPHRPQFVVPMPVP